MKMNIEKLKQIVEGNAFQESHGSTTLVVDLQTVLDLLDELEQSILSEVSISVERAKKYARHQHFLGTQGTELVELEDWAKY